jgi:hypothetical protein
VNIGGLWVTFCTETNDLNAILDPFNIYKTICWFMHQKVRAQLTRLKKGWMNSSIIASLVG